MMEVKRLFSLLIDNLLFFYFFFFEITSKTIPFIPFTVILEQ